MIVDSLKQVLADAVAMYHKAHGYHWNVMGPDFQQFHAFMSSLYEDVYGSVDPIAENIRKRDAFPPFTVHQLAQMTKIRPNDAGTDPIAQVRDLNSANDVLLSDLQIAFDDATQANDQGLANFLAERLDAHRKWRWQMMSIMGETNPVSKMRRPTYRPTLFI